MLHYIITNRQILTDVNGEFIRPDGGESPSENIRFGTFDSAIYNATKDKRKSVTLFADPVPPTLTAHVTDAETQPYTAGLVQTPTENLIGSKKSILSRVFTPSNKESKTRRLSKRM